MKRLWSSTVFTLIFIMIGSLLGAAPIAAIVGGVSSLIIGWVYDVIDCCMGEYKSLNKEKK